MGTFFSLRKKHNSKCRGSGLRCNCGGLEEVAMIVMAVSAVAGVAMTATSMANQPKAPGLPETPTKDTAAADADKALTQQRRTALATGGLTDYTGGSGIILGSDVKSASLIG